MTSATDERRLAYEYYRGAGVLTDRHAIRGAAVEAILTATYDADRPHRDALTALRGIRPDLTLDEIDEQVDHLLELADEVESWNNELGHRAAWHAAQDDYADALYEFVLGDQR